MTLLQSNETESIIEFQNSRGDEDAANRPNEPVEVSNDPFCSFDVWVLVLSFDVSKINMSIKDFAGVHD